MRLHAEVRGRGTDLLLLHGWGMNAAVWTPLLAPLAAHFRLTLIELPGHGASGYDPTAVTLDDWAGAVLEAAPRRAAWLGWSLGGQIALRAALLEPARVERLLLVAANPSFVRRDDWPHAMDGATLEQFAAALLEQPRQTLERFLSLQVRGDEAARETLRLLRQEIARRPAPDPRALERGLALLRDVDLRAQLARIACPMLWLLGERDSLVPAALDAELERRVPAARRMILPGCAHAPFLSHPEQSLRALMAFMGVSDAGIAASH
ncbi:MAG: pimeloyl-ACP methyl ester esterase BioH [Candidatus Sedimenticola endophacoides]